MSRLLAPSLLAFIFLIQLVATAEAYEGFNLSISNLYYEYKVKNETMNSDTKQREWLLNTRAGYVLKNGIYFGATYENHELGSNSSFNLTGASVGSVTKRDYILLHYFVSSDHQLDASTEGRKGSGYGIDIGSTYPLCNNILYIGWELSYRSIKYDETKFNGVSVDEKYEYSSFYPLIVLGFAL